VPIPDVSDQTIATLISLAGRTAVVTGGARNIGLAIVRRLSEAGARVVICDNDADEGVAAVEYLQSQGGVAEFVLTDMTDGTSVARVADHVVTTYGGIDIWVNNAGMFPSRPALEMSDEDWDQMMDLNMRGTFLGAREAARRMVERGRPGVVVNIASCAGFRTGGINMSHYVASKFGVRGLTMALAAELGEHGIRVIAVAPTYIERREAARIHVSDPNAGMEERPPTLSFPLPLGRAGVPDDIARVVLFCASDLALLMTGSTIPVDAGQLAL
jgi:NAD(P)-dependent dehydrogenase (short-subunit alcohol dehydrogenase family)